MIATTAKAAMAAAAARGDEDLAPLGQARLMFCSARTTAGIEKFSVLESPPPVPGSTLQIAGRRRFPICFSLLA